MFCTAMSEIKILSGIGAQEDIFHKGVQLLIYNVIYICVCITNYKLLYII